MNLSLCLNPQFVPSLNLVNKIIRFYNLNLMPEIDSYRFLHEKLELTVGKDDVEKPGAELFCGFYRCYYYLGNRGKKASRAGFYS